MSSDSLRDDLTVEPNEEGIKRRQAEYLVLCCLKTKEVASKRELERDVKKLSAKIAEQNGEPPIYFGSTTSHVEHRSREFNEVLERCLHRDWIEPTIDGKYGITDQGVERVDDLQSESKYNIHEIADWF